MQKPHVLQWLARGGRHMLQVEQYLHSKHRAISVLSAVRSHLHCFWADRAGRRWGRTA